MFMQRNERTNERLATLGYLLLLSASQNSLRRFIYPYKFQLTINHSPTKVTQKF